MRGHGSSLSSRFQGKQLGFAFQCLQFLESCNLIAETIWGFHFKEERHAYQTAMVDALEKTLKEVEVAKWVVAGTFTKTALSLTLSSVYTHV